MMLIIMLIMNVKIYWNSLKVKMPFGTTDTASMQPSTSPVVWFHDLKFKNGILEWCGANVETEDAWISLFLCDVFMT